jgi:hypothetical protein
MNKKAKLTGIALAIGVASVFALAPVIATAASPKVNCYGIKGKKVMKMTEKKCAKMGGTTEEPKAAEGSSNTSTSTDTSATTTQ